jgi:DNA-binding Lrp family transcriptional regulator
MNISTFAKIFFLFSRISFTDISKECKITVGAVRMRYKRLCRKGAINGEFPLINPHCLGYRHIVDLGSITETADKKEAMLKEGVCQNTG